MTEPKNGFEILAELRERNGRQYQNFKALTRYLDEKARDKGVPVFGQFELTPLCNFNCRMCYVHLNAEQLKGQAILPVDTWKDLMHQAWEAGMIHSTLTGGECLAYPGFDELYLYLHELGCEIGILTNGFLMDEKRIEFFRKHMPARIQVTLYGQNEDVYERVTGQRAFGRVTENIRKALEAGLPVSLSVTPCSYLGEDVMETIRLGRSITDAFTLNSGIFRPREETGRSGQQDNPETEQYIRIYQLLNELDGKESLPIDEDRLPPAGGPYHECEECGLLCGGGRSSFVMNWKGILTPCNRLDMIHADALREGFRAAWKTVNQGANSWPRVPECRDCPYQGICNTCAANQLQFAAPGKLPRELCERTRQLVLHGVGQIPECE